MFAWHVVALRNSRNKASIKEGDCLKVTQVFVRYCLKLLQNGASKTSIGVQLD